jgi:hypothetical protein
LHMALSITELWQQIAAANLASPVQCRSWATEVARQLPATDVVDGGKVLQALVEMGKLSEYQARALAGHSELPLQRGSWSIRSIFDDGVWTGWSEVVRDPDFTQPVWSRWINGKQLDNLASSSPSLTRAASLAGLQHPNIQQVFAPIREQHELQLLVQPAVGKLLSQRVTGPVDWRTATQMILAIARGLAEIHALGLAHGRLLPDRIALMSPSSTDASPRATRERIPLLLCDPLAAATATADRSARGLLGEQLGTMLQEQFIAPEFLAPGQLPSPASDVYSLGCTWYWLLVGRPPAAGRSAQEALANQIRVAPALPERIRCGTEVARCLAHCLAKNLPARFDSAIELVRALERALACASENNKPSIVKPIVKPAPASDPPGLVTPAASDRAAGPHQRPEAGHAQAGRGSGVVPIAAELAEPTTTPATRHPAAVEKHAQPTKITAEVVDTAVSGRAAPPGQPPLGRPISRQMKRGKTRRKANPRLLIMSAGVCGFALLLLGVLKFSGALEPKPVAGNSTVRVPPEYRPSATPTTSVDPRSSVYQIVDTGNHLWAPPKLPSPLPLELLPPGGQLFVGVRPREWLERGTPRKLLGLFSDPLQSSLDWLSTLAGQPLEAIEQATVVGYDSPRGDGLPDYAVRFSLTKPKPLSSLRLDWNVVNTLDVDGQSLLVSSSGMAYYVPQQPLIDAQGVQVFSCGPAELMKGVAEFKGAAAPMTAAMEKLWQQSDQTADLCIQASPRFLFSGGRGVVEAAPLPFKENLNKLLNQDSRAVLVKSFLEPQWYIEAQIIAATDRDTAALVNQLEKQLSSAPSLVEDWLVQARPHPYWGAVALRYPQMLRELREFARFGVESGVAIANAYLPTDGGSNLLAATWIAMQPSATIADHAASDVGAGASPLPLTMEQLLARPIRLTFEQEPIEVALQLIGEEAIAGLPAGSPRPRFFLDGDAFSIAGITRNQQLRDFKMENRPVREALTEVAKRGNTITTVTDTRQAEQKLIWAVAPDPMAPGQSMILLTTREAAADAGLALPVEFAP